MEIRYSYAPVPTVRKFAQSDAFVRGLMGPFGSGKSSGCVFELVRRAQRQAPGPDGKRRTRWAVIRNCYDDQTEILTETRGWQSFAALQKGEWGEPADKVATLKDGVLTFETPTLHYSARYDGEMIGFDTDGANFLVTPDHKLYTSKRQTRQRVWSEFDFETAADAYGKTLRRFKRDAEWVGEVPAAYDEQMFEFLGFWFAEGYAGVYPRKDGAGEHYRLVVTQSKYVDYTRELLRKTGFEWGESAKESGFNFSISTATGRVKALICALSMCGGSALEKFLPAWVKNAPRGHLRRFLHGFLMGDGHIAHNSSEVTRAWTSSPQLADDLQEVALKAGWVANVACRDVRPSEGSYRPNGPQYVVTFLSKKRSSPTTAAGWYKADYHGMVYCVEVSTHIVYVRRGGKAFWCSQTYRQLTDTTIKTVNQWLPPGVFGDFRLTDMQYMVKAIPECEIEILFRALDRPDHLANLLSFELTGAWINEAREIPKTIVDGLQGRVGRYPAIREGGATWHGVFMDTNPPDSDSWWYKMFEEWPETADGAATLAHYRASNGRDFSAIFKQPSGLSSEAENLANLPNGRGYYETLAAGKDREWVKVYVEGEYGFVVDGRPVFPEYNDALHCSEKAVPLRGEPLYRGWDWGLTGACVLLQKNSFGQVVVFDELQSDGAGIEAFGDDVLAMCSSRWSKSALGWAPEWLDVGDPAGQSRAPTDERTCFQIMAAKGVEVEPGEQNPAFRQECVRKALTTLRNGRPGFLLHPRCKQLRKGFLGGYQFRRLNTTRERYTEKPDKNEYSHPHDALQYPLTILLGSSLTASQPRKQNPLSDAELFGADPREDSTRNPVTGY